MLRRPVKATGIPALKVGDTWIHDPKEKAQSLANTWLEKSRLPPMPDNMPSVGQPTTRMIGPIFLRSRYTLKILKSLDVRKATGPDHMPARLLVNIATCIYKALSILCRRILFEGRWPECWRKHYLVPVFKRKEVFLCKKYRGIHLTSIMSKVAERVIG